MPFNSFFQKARKSLRGRPTGGSVEPKNAQDDSGQAAASPLMVAPQTNAQVPCPEGPSATSFPSVRQMTAGQPATPLPPHSRSAVSDTRSRALPGAEGPQFLQSLRESDGEAESETSAAVIGSDRAERGDTQKLAAESSLWDRAYDALRHENSDRIAQYEHLLSLVPVRGQTTVLTTLDENEAAGHARDLPQHDAAARREMLKSIAELGLKHMEEKKVRVTVLGHEIVLQDHAQSVAVVVGWGEDFIKDAVRDLPYASIVWAGIALVLPLLKNPVAAEAANREGFAYITSQMRYYVAMESLLLPETMKSDLREDLEEGLVKLYKLIIDFQVQSIMRFYRTRTKNFFRETINYDGWDQMLKDVKEEEAGLVRKFETAMSGTGLGVASKSLQKLEELANAAEATRKVQEENLVLIVKDLRDIHRMQQEQFLAQTSEKDQQCLQYLRLTDPRHDKTRIEQAKGGLLDGAYQWILNHPDFLKWQNDEQRRILWIKGGAGKGKTMLLIGLINELERLTGAPDAGLLSFFLCQGTDEQLNKATAVLRGLVYLLILQQGCLVSHLRTEYDRAGQRLLEGENSFHALSTIFHAMLNDPRLTEAYFVVDALDECETGLALLLDLITRTASDASARVKWIVSSRNIPDIERHLGIDDGSMKLSLEVNAQLVSQAVEVYIDFKISQLAAIRCDNPLQEQVRSIMRQKADGTFLWLALVFKELQTVESYDVLDVLDEMPPELTPLYDRMMSHIARLKRRDQEFCCLVLSTATIAYRPLHWLELRMLAGVQAHCPDFARWERIINLCGSFLTTRGGFVYFVHQSAKDYIAANASSIVFPSGPGLAQSCVVSRSLNALSNTLRRNIYNLSHSGIEIDDVKELIPDPMATVQYSSIHWVDHFCEAQYPSTERQAALSDGGAIILFFKEHLLHWIESLSLLRRLPDGLLSIRKLLRVVLPQSHASPRIIRFLEDAEKFVATYRSIIEEAPLQIYSSALLFCPTQTEIRRQYWTEQGSSLKIVAGTRDVWGSCQQTLEAHLGGVNAIAFSPDGMTLASASNTVRLWDVATGALRKPLKCDIGRIQRVTFASDGKTLAWASWDGTVELWDVTLESYQETQEFEEHVSFITVMSFAPDRETAASASYNNSIRLWDVKSGSLRRTLKGHSGYVNALTFAPNSKTIASASVDKTVCLWDALAGMRTQTLKGHSSSVTAVAFTPDGRTLVSASKDRTVRLWNPATGQPQQVLEEFGCDITAIAFTPDGKALASALKDGTLRLWDLATGTHRQTFKGHNSYGTKIAFASDGRTVALALSDNTVCLWDTTTETNHQILVGHSSVITAVAFAPDGKTVVSASADTTIRLWYTAAGTHWQTLQGHDSCVTAMVFAPDGRTLMSASDDQFRLWDATTGMLQETQRLSGYDTSAKNVAFTSDCRTVASASIDNTVQLWDAATGTHQKTLEGHSGYVVGIAFSPDSKTVVSCSRDQTICTWDMATGGLLQTLSGYKCGDTFCSYNIVFSPDSKMIAAASSHNTVQLWDAVTGVHLRTLEGHGGHVRDIVFAPDSKAIASASDDRTAWLWDATTGTCQHRLEGHSGSVWAVAFAPDGKMLASAADDRTVRLWDIAIKVPWKTREGHSDYVTSIAFSSDGKMVASASHDNTVRLWDTATGMLRQTLEGHDAMVMTVNFVPGSPILVSTSHDSTIRLWDTVAGTHWRTLEGHSGWIDCVALAPDNKTLYSASSTDHTVRLWDVATGTHRHTLGDYSSSAQALAFSLDGKMVALGLYDGTVRLWDATTGILQHVFEGHSDGVEHWNGVEDIAFAPDGKTIATASRDLTVRLWNIATGTLWQTLEGHTDWLAAVTFSPDGKRVASASSDGTVQLWDVATGTCQRTLEVYTRLEHLSISEDGQYLDTDRGRLSIDSDTDVLDICPQHEPSDQRVFVTKDWISFGGKELFWIPPDYRMTCVAVRGNILVLGHASGRMVFLQFAVS